MASTFRRALQNVKGSLGITSAPKFAIVSTGTGADQANKIFTRSYILAASPLLIDLTNMTDVEGITIVLARVKSISIVNGSKTPGQGLLIGYPTTITDAWTALVSNPGQITVRPSTANNQGAFAVTAPDGDGFPVSPTNKLLLIDPGANTIPVDIEIVGADA